VIAQAERERVAILATLERLQTNGKRVRGAQAKLRIADYRLQLLRRTRAWVSAGDLPTDLSGG
jgi:hypothetical protein